MQDKGPSKDEEEYPFWNLEKKSSDDLNEVVDHHPQEQEQIEEQLLDSTLDPNIELIKQFEEQESNDDPMDLGIDCLQYYWRSDQPNGQWRSGDTDLESRRATLISILIDLGQQMPVNATAEEHLECAIGVELSSYCSAASLQEYESQSNIPSLLNTCDSIQRKEVPQKKPNDSNHSPIAPLFALTSRKIHHNDVLAGNGVDAVNSGQHGTEEYRRLIALNRDDYAEAQHSDKAAITDSIVCAIRSKNPPGRFLKRNSRHVFDVWFELTEKRVRNKVGQDLRVSFSCKSKRKNTGTEQGHTDNAAMKRQSTGTAVAAHPEQTQNTVQATTSDVETDQTRGFCTTSYAHFLDPDTRQPNAPASRAFAQSSNLAQSQTTNPLRHRPNARELYQRSSPISNQVPQQVFVRAPVVSVGTMLWANNHQLAPATHHQPPPRPPPPQQEFVDVSGIPSAPFRSANYSKNVASLSQPPQPKHEQVHPFPAAQLSAVRTSKQGSLPPKHQQPRSQGFEEGVTGTIFPSPIRNTAQRLLLQNQPSDESLLWDFVAPFLSSDDNPIDPPQNEPPPQRIHRRLASAEASSPPPISNILQLEGGTVPPPGYFPSNDNLSSHRSFPPAHNPQQHHLVQPYQQQDDPNRPPLTSTTAVNDHVEQQPSEMSRVDIANSNYQSPDPFPPGHRHEQDVSSTEQQENRPSTTPPLDEQ